MGQSPARPAGRVTRALLVLTLTVTLGLAACGDTQDDGGPKAPTGSAPTGSASSSRSAPGATGSGRPGPPSPIPTPSGPTSRPPTTTPTPVHSPTAGSPAPDPSASRGPGGGATAGAACPSATVTVRDAGGLKAALAAAGPGTVIRLAPGRYSGKFELSARGSQRQPVFLCGQGATLAGSTVATGTGLHLKASSWVRVVGLEVTDYLKGIMVDSSTNIVIQGATVHHIGNEGIHLRSFTTDSTVQGNTVHHTGLRDAKFGEGIYVGTAVQNWGKITGGKPDACDRNNLVGNTIWATSAESIDIKEGTRAGVVRSNTFDGTGMTPAGADSWVDVKGNGWTITGNVGKNSPKDGFQVHQVVPGLGVGNTFAGNRGSGLGRTRAGSGSGFLLDSKQGLDNVFGCSNRVTDGSGRLGDEACFAGS